MTTHTKPANAGHTPEAVANASVAQQATDAVRDGDVARSRGGKNMGEMLDFSEKVKTGPDGMVDIARLEIPHR